MAYEPRGLAVISGSSDARFKVLDDGTVELKGNTLGGLAVTSGSIMMAGAVSSGQYPMQSFDIRGAHGGYHIGLSSSNSTLQTALDVGDNRDNISYGLTWVYEQASSNANLTIDADAGADEAINLGTETYRLAGGTGVTTTNTSNTTTITLDAEIAKLAGMPAADELAVITAAEMTMLDGGTARGTDAVASGDGIVTNDGGTMRQTNVTAFQTYFDANSVGGTNMVTVGALNAGSISTGFGAIDNGVSNITTGGILTLDVDVAAAPSTSQAVVGQAGSLQIGTGGDAGLGVHSDDLYVENKTSDKDIVFRINDGGTLTTVAHVDGADGRFQFAAGKLDIGGTAVTTTAAELNLLASANVTTAELNKLAGSTSDSAANKLIILDGSGDFEMQDNDKIFFGTGADVSIHWDGSAMKIGTDTSAAPITIGHTTSEVTIGDNLTVTGDLTVTGKTITDTVEVISTSNGVQFEGGVEDGHDAILKSAVADSDKTYTLPNLTGHIPLLAGAAQAADVTYAEFALLDGGSTVGTTAVAGGDGIFTNDGGVMKHTTVDTFDTYLSQTTKTLTNKTLTSPTITGTGAIAGVFTGNLTGNASGTAATVTQAAQTAITSVGTLTALQVDNININGNTITSSTAADLTINVTDGQSVVIEGLDIDDGVVTGASSITSTAFVGDLTGDVTGNTSGTAATVTGAAQTAITSVGTLTALQVDNVNINGNAITSSTAADLTINVADGQAAVIEGLSIDDGVVTGASSITSTNFVGALTGNVAGNASGTAATVTGAAQTAITSVGTLTALDVDNVNINGNTITASTGALNLTPAGGSAIVLDGAINVDAGVVTGATSITSTAFVGGLTGNVTGNASGTALSVTQAAQTAITSVGTLTGLAVNGDATLTGNSANAVWDSSEDALEFADNASAEFGTGLDMKLYHDGTNSYITNAVGDLKVATETSGIAITLGHSTSEVTVADNLTVAGNLTVTGTTTTVDVEVVNTANGVIFEGATDDAYETTLKAVDPTGADKTHQLANVSGFLVPFAAASTTAITATPAELNYLDNDALEAADLTKLAAVTATAAELNYLDDDDLTAADLTKLAAVTATATELNYLDDDDLTAADLTKLAAITATAAEINDLAGNAVAAADFTKLAAVTATAAELNLLDAAAGSSVALASGDGMLMFDATDSNNAKKVLMSDVETFIEANVDQFTNAAGLNFTTGITGSATSEASATDGAIRTLGGISSAKGLYVVGAANSTIANLGNPEVGGFIDYRQNVRLGGSLQLAKISGNSHEGQDIMCDLSDATALAAGTYDGYMLYVQSAMHSTSSRDGALNDSDNTPRAKNNFDVANKFYFCEEGVWHMSPFATAAEE